RSCSRHTTGVARNPNALFARRDVERRVPEAQAHARSGLTAALAFVTTAAVIVAIGGDRWIAVHLFVAGGLTSAFSGVSIMLASTWSTAPAPAPGLGHLQRGAIVAGALGIILGRHLEAGAPTFHLFGAVYALGLLGLALLLVDTVRHGTKRRFDPAITGWVVALALSILGSTAGIALATGTSVASLRSVHLTTHPLGLLCIAIA